MNEYENNYQRPNQNQQFNNQDRPFPRYQGNNSGGRFNNTPIDRNAPLPAPVFYKPYGVVGNRDWPADMNQRVIDLVKKLSGLGFVPRTGYMDGLEKVVADAAPDTELQLPWKNFAEKESKNTYSSPEVLAIAKHFSIGFDELKLPIKGFLGKNVRVLLGSKSISRSVFLLCYSEDGAETTRQVTGRTGTAGHAIKVACFFNIPVFNLSDKDAEQKLFSYLGQSNDVDRPMFIDEEVD